VQHQYLDDGLAPGNDSESDIVVISATYSDDDAQSATTSRFLTINNAQPALSLNTLPDMAVNSTASLRGSYADVGLLDSHTLAIDWGDGSTSTFSIPAIRDAAGNSTLNFFEAFTSTSGDGAVLTVGPVNSPFADIGFTVDHQFTSSGLKTITVSITDDDAGSAVETISLTISPTVL